MWKKPDNLVSCQPRSQGKRRDPGNEVVMCHGHGPRSSTGGGGGGWDSKVGDSRRLALRV